MNLEIQCPGCRKEYKISNESWIGRDVTCKTCLTEFKVQKPTLEPLESIAGPALETEDPYRPTTETVQPKPTIEDQIALLVDRIDVLLAHRNEPRPLGAGFYFYFFFLALPALAVSGAGVPGLWGVSFFLMVVSILLWQNLYRFSPYQQFKDDAEWEAERARDRAQYEAIRAQERIAVEKFKSFFRRKKKEPSTEKLS